MMARFTQKSDGIPPDLRTYDEGRWIQAATAAGDCYVRHIPPEQRPAHWYCRFIIAPSYYRQALADAVGRAAGDAYFYQPGRLTPVGAQVSVPTGREPRRVGQRLGAASPGPGGATS